MRSLLVLAEWEQRESLIWAIAKCCNWNTMYPSRCYPTICVEHNFSISGGDHFMSPPCIGTEDKHSKTTFEGAQAQQHPGNVDHTDCDDSSQHLISEMSCWIKITNTAAAKDGFRFCPYISPFSFAGFCLRDSLGVSGNHLQLSGRLCCPIDAMG